MTCSVFATATCTASPPINAPTYSINHRYSEQPSSTSFYIPHTTQPPGSHPFPSANDIHIAMAQMLTPAHELPLANAVDIDFMHFCCVTFVKPFWANGSHSRGVFIKHFPLSLTYRSLDLNLQVMAASGTYW